MSTAKQIGRQQPPILPVLAIDFEAEFMWTSSVAQAQLQTEWVEHR